MSQMWGRTPTSKEKKWIDWIMKYGCYCCRKSGIENDYILPHHTDGRTKPDAHMRAIPLCSPHHDYNSPFGIHANMGAWRAIWGREEAILKELRKEFEEQGGQT